MASPVSSITRKHGIVLIERASDPLPLNQPVPKTQTRRVSQRLRSRITAKAPTAARATPAEQTAERRAVAVIHRPLAKLSARRRHQALLTARYTSVIRKHASVAVAQQKQQQQANDTESSASTLRTPRLFPRWSCLYELAVRLHEAGEAKTSPGHWVWYTILCAVLSPLSCVRYLPPIRRQQDKILEEISEIPTNLFRTSLSLPQINAHPPRPWFSGYDPATANEFLGEHLLHTALALLPDRPYLFYQGFEYFFGHHDNGYIAKTWGAIVGNVATLAVPLEVVMNMWLWDISDSRIDFRCTLTPMILWALQHACYFTSDTWIFFTDALLRIIPKQACWRLCFSRVTNPAAWSQFFDMLRYLTSEERATPCTPEVVWRMTCFFLFEPLNTWRSTFMYDIEHAQWMETDPEYGQFANNSGNHTNQTDLALYIDRRAVLHAECANFLNMFFSATEISLNERAELFATVSRAEKAPPIHPANTAPSRAMIHGLHFTTDDALNWMRGSLCRCPLDDEDVQIAAQMQTARNRPNVARRLALGNACDGKCSGRFYGRKLGDRGFGQFPLVRKKHALVRSLHLIPKPLELTAVESGEETCYVHEEPAFLRIPAIFARVLEDAEIRIHSTSSSEPSQLHPTQTGEDIVFPTSVPDLPPDFCQSPPGPEEGFFAREDLDYVTTCPPKYGLPS